MKPLLRRNPRQGYAGDLLAAGSSPPISSPAGPSPSISSPASPSQLISSPEPFVAVLHAGELVTPSPHKVVAGGEGPLFWSWRHYHSNREGALIFLIVLLPIFFPGLFSPLGGASPSIFSLLRIEEELGSDAVYIGENWRSP